MTRCCTSTSSGCSAIPRCTSSSCPAWASCPRCCRSSRASRCSATRSSIFSGIAIGFLGWGVWAHHMFATGLGPVAISAFGLSTMLIAIPTGVKIFNWLGTVYGGAVRLTTAMLFSLGFIAMFTIGGLSGVLALDRPGRHAADRHLLRRRALPLRAVRRPDVRRLLRLLLLVAEGLRPACSTSGSAS